MYALSKVKLKIAEELSKALEGIEIVASDFSRPPQTEMGDLAYPCFKAAKAQGKSPAAIATEVAEKLTGLEVAEAFAAGPYVNFRFDKKSFSTSVLEDVFGRASAYGDAEKTGRPVLLEYGSPNTHKEIHVGHLLNFSYGLAVGRLQRAVGNDVTSVNYIGDIGAHVAKWIWYYEKSQKGEVEKVEVTEDGGMKAFGQIYTRATKLVAEDEDKYKAEISEVLQSLEKRDPERIELWEKTRDECLRQIDLIFKQLGINFARTYLESEVEEDGKVLVAELEKGGVATEGERGAKIVDLSDQDLGVFLVLKSDGTALYSTKELALAKKKFADYPKTQESLIVVDNRQSQYFRQFFATLEKMGFNMHMRHLSHDFVTLEDGAMSSREGNVITYEDFRDDVVSRTKAETRSRHEDWSDEQVEKTAWLVAEAAMKFGMLKQDLDRPIVFNMESAASFDGYTGPYVQYAYARLSSILAKSDDDTVSVCKASDNAEEYALLRLVADFPAIVSEAARDHRPSLVAQYAFDLAQASNSFYRDVPVLSAEKDDRCRRLAIIEATRKTLERSLYLLGIGVPQEM